MPTAVRKKTPVKKPVKKAAVKTPAKPVKKVAARKKPVSGFIKLDIHTDQVSAKWKKAFPQMDQKIELAAAAAFFYAKKPAAFTRRHFEVSVILTDDKMIKTLNHDYRSKNMPTNVLSFPQFNMTKFKGTTLDMFPASATIPVGDVVLAFETIQREAKTEKKTIEAHVTHLVIHGVLHLLGYDHMRAKDAKSMEKLECDILETLGYDNPYHAKKPQKQKP